jgi:HEAT repeat protein
MLGSVGGEKALALLEKTLADQDAMVRRDAASALVWMGGEKALALLEKALADQDADVRGDVARLQAFVGGDKALAWLDKALADHDAAVRSEAAQALGIVGGDKARDLLLGTLAGEKDRGVRKKVRDALKSTFADDPAVVKALKNFTLPEDPASQPPPKPKEVSDF